MKISTLALAAGVALVAGSAQAAGPLYLTEGLNPQPWRWNTSNGPIPVWTDGGGAFTYDFDGVTPFITIERANEITQFAFDQWNNVPTATFNAQVAGTIESQTGVADVTVDTADQIYFVENGRGFWVVYDTDGTILSDLFGVSPTAVLGIAFPEFANEDGEIIEATALMNGYAVNVNDPTGAQFAGVFTHEFGHAINLAHSQTNGQIAYFNTPSSPKYPGVPGCGPFPALTDAKYIETMYPFISTNSSAGAQQSTVDLPDDIASISELYPTPDYKPTTGSITGVLTLKDGKTQYSGINIIARNVNDLYGDAVSAMTGDQSQGQIGPDGRFTINNLTPGQDYVLYMERIVAGGFPTTPMQLVSTPEYWNDAESNDPATDQTCDATPIRAEAGVTKTANFTFNGYLKGIQYTPIVAAFLTDLAKNGRSSAGQVSSTAFVWDENKDFLVLPPQIKAATGTSVFTRNGGQMLVQYDFDGDGIQQGAIFDFDGDKGGGVISLGDLNGDSCGGSSSNGVNSSAAWAIDDFGRTAVGLAYVDRNGNGSCNSSFANEIVPFIWDNKKGIRELDTSGFASPPQFVRAHAISGDGSVVLGAAGSSTAVAWVNEGELINLRTEFNSNEAYALNFNGTRVAMQTRDGVVLWNPKTGASENIGGLAWCVDLPALQFGTDLCAVYGPEVVQAALGPIPVTPSDMTNDGSVIVGRGGSFRLGIAGAIWIEDLGWMSLANFFRKQGVAEAFDLPINNPIAISATGREIVGGLAGATFSWLVEMEQVYVCEGGQSVQTGFPNGLREKIAEGAKFGRCEFID